MARVYLSIGGNIEPATHIRAALRDLRGRFGELVLSPVYESAAVGFSGDNFLNLAAGFDTDLEVHALNQALHEIEDRNGRLRGAEKFSSRTVDIDLLLYDDLCIEEPGLSLPRDEILKYAFVLKPLADLIPNEKHPLEGRSYKLLWEGFKDREQQPLREVEGEW